MCVLKTAGDVVGNECMLREGTTRGVGVGVASEEWGECDPDIKRRCKVIEDNNRKQPITRDSQKYKYTLRLAFISG
jgi:hypothetical protein